VKEPAVAAIHADLSTTPTGNPPDTASTTVPALPSVEPVAGVAGALVIGRLAATGARLAGLFGPPQITAPLREGGLGWVIETPGGIAGVRAWRHRTRLRTDTRHDPHTLTRWQIVADRAGPLPWLCKTITGSTAGLASLAAAADAPVHAQAGGGGVRLLDLAWAYADYLYLHGQAIQAWLANTNRLGRAHRSRRHLPLQLNLQLQPLVQVLHRHQAATATAAQRAAWAAMPCPLHADDQDTGRHHDQADDRGGLRHWRASTRWLHQPDHPHHPHDPTSVPDQQVADPDPVDLAGMLRALADRHARYRPQVLTINPALDMTTYDEYQATLHALATTSLNDHRSGTRGPAADPT